jgi:hypothetical protein
MSSNNLKLTRRYFLQQAAMTSALVGGVAGVLVTTDALAQIENTPVGLLHPEPHVEIYTYHIHQS